MQRGHSMNNYKGYLRGVNPNNTRKLLMDEQSFAYEASTGTFVNGIGEEVKTMKEAIAKNEKLDAELKNLFPPQKAVGATPVSRNVIHKQIAKVQKPMRPNRARPTTSYAAIKKSEPIINTNSAIDELIRHREEMIKIEKESARAREEFNRKMQTRKVNDDDKGLSGLMGGGFDV